MLTINPKYVVDDQDEKTAVLTMKENCFLKVL